jgi:urea transport system permease protein
VGIINPSEMAPDKSLEAVVWVAVGGRGTLVGPILGALGVNWLKSYATHKAPEYWLYMLGGLFIVVTVFFPKGIFGIPEQVRTLKSRWFPRETKPNGIGEGPAPLGGSKVETSPTP